MKVLNLVTGHEIHVLLCSDFHVAQIQHDHLDLAFMLVLSIVSVILYFSRDSYLSRVCRMCFFNAILIFSDVFAFMKVFLAEIRNDAVCNAEAGT